MEPQAFQVCSDPSPSAVLSNDSWRAQFMIMEVAMNGAAVQAHKPQQTKQNSFLMRMAHTYPTLQI